MGTLFTDRIRDFRKDMHETDREYYRKCILIEEDDENPKNGIYIRWVLDSYYPIERIQKWCSVFKKYKGLFRYDMTIPIHRKGNRRTTICFKTVVKSLGLFIRACGSDIDILWLNLRPKTQTKSTTTTIPDNKWRRIRNQLKHYISCPSDLPKIGLSEWLYSYEEIERFKYLFYVEPIIEYNNQMVYGLISIFMTRSGDKKPKNNQVVVLQSNNNNNNSSSPIDEYLNSSLFDMNVILFIVLPMVKEKIRWS